MQTAESPGPKGTVEGGWFPNANRVVTQPPGVEQAAKGSTVCACGMWEVLSRLTRGNIGSGDVKMPACGQDGGGGVVAKRRSVMGRTG